MDSRFIHFGGDHFCPEEFKPIKNYETSFIKHHGELWTSPLSTNDWAEYCKDNMMNNKLWNGWFTFHLKKIILKFYKLQIKNSLMMLITSLEITIEFLIFL